MLQRPLDLPRCIATGLTRTADALLSTLCHAHHDDCSDMQRVMIDDDSIARIHGMFSIFWSSLSDHVLIPDWQQCELRRRLSRPGMIVYCGATDVIAFHEAVLSTPVGKLRGAVLAYLATTAVSSIMSTAVALLHRLGYEVAYVSSLAYAGDLARASGFTNSVFDTEFGTAVYLYNHTYDYVDQSRVLWQP